VPIDVSTESGIEIDATSGSKTSADAGSEAAEMRQVVAGSSLWVMSWHPRR
jgi:hypothetical protein